MSKIDWDYWGKRYIDEDLTHEEIGDMIGVHRKTVGRNFKKLKIKKDTKGVSYWLQIAEKYYLDGDMSQAEIGDMLGIDGSTVCRKFQKIGIKKEENIDWEKIGNQYFVTNKLTVKEVASILDKSVMTVYRHFNKYGIKSDKSKIDWEYLGNKYYVTNKKSLRDIAKIAGVSDRAAAYHFNKLGIEVDHIGYIRKIFNEEGYELLEDEFISSTANIKYKCDRGHVGVTTWENFNSGIRCAQCAREDDPGLYSLNLAERNKNEWLNKFCHVYKIRLSNDEENFYKIGISVNINNRFAEFSALYKLDVIELIETDLYNAIHLEVKLHKEHDVYRYIPKIKFGGYTECFTKLIT